MRTSARLGPDPIRTDRPRDAGLRVLRALASRESATLADLADALGGHPNTTRAQLEHLVAAGFATALDLPASGRGRPAHAWAATIAGRQVAGEDPNLDRQAALLEAVAEHLDGTPDPAAAAHAIGLGWGHRLAATRNDSLVPILAAQGFTPEEQDDGIALRTCPLLASARQRPAVVCGIHQGLIDAVSPAAWALEPFAAPGACLLRRRGGAA
ncbi:MAG: helix-turn-helix domain-containing protein [Propionibacteriaceae bacterium]|nr:helix-turn-helix domain-containing protein [Propionibacteriaceae bacterium]